MKNQQNFSLSRKNEDRYEFLKKYYSQPSPKNQKIGKKGGRRKAKNPIPIAL